MFISTKVCEGMRRIEVEVCSWSLEEGGCGRVVEFVEIVRSCKSWNEIY